MARDGSGNYSRVEGPYVNGEIAQASEINNEYDDFAAAVSDSINKAGTKAFAANQPMGGFKITGLGAATAAGDAVRYEQILPSVFQPLDGTLTALAALSWSSGSPLLQFTAADTVSLTLTPSVTTLSVPDGSAAAPAIKVGDEQNGLYSNAANSLGIAAGGLARITIPSSGKVDVSATSGLAFAAGSAGTPAINIRTADTGTGIYSIGTNNWGFSCNSNLVFDFNTARLLMASLYDLQRATDVVTPTAASVGYMGTVISAMSGDRTVAGVDDGQTLYHTSASTHTLTINSNANLALPIGFMCCLENENGAGAVSIAITSDTLRWGSSTGTRSLAANGSAYLKKVAATVWRLTGTGIT